MPLDISSLQTAITTAFKKAKSTPPPSDPSKSDQVQEQILTQLGLDLASAVNAFVRGADVIGVTVAVVDPSNKPIGTGTETGTGKLQ